MTRGGLPFLTDDAGRKPGPGGYRVAWKGPSMAELIAIGYPEEATAQQARDEVSQQLDRPDTARAIIRNCEGSIWVATNLYGLAVGIIWGMFLGMLVGLGFGTGLGSGCWRRPWGGYRQGRPVRDRPEVPGPGPGHARARHLYPGRAGEQGNTGTVAEALSRHGAPSWSPPCPRMPSGGSRRPYWDGPPDKRQPVGLRQGQAGDPTEASWSFSWSFRFNARRWPSSSAHDEQNSGGRTIQPACGPGAHSRASRKPTCGFAAICTPKGIG
jgi:hypothetical protein